MKEIKRVKGFDSGNVACLKCGKELHLFYNGGELDRLECCGLSYQTEHVQTDLVIYEEEET